MGKFKEKLQTMLRLLSMKKMSTIAGALSFFCLLGGIPLVYLCFYFLSLLNIDVNPIKDNFDFGVLSEAVKYIFSVASEGKRGVTLTFILTVIYSSSKIFYHLLRSGEIIYGTNRTGATFIVKAIAVLLSLMCVFVIVACIIVAITTGVFYKNDNFTILRMLIFYAVCAVLVLFCLIIINKVVCPYKIRIAEVFVGSVVTLVLWVAFSVGFAFYCNYIANFSRLYGTASFLIVFLLWLQLMSQAFVIGVITSFSRLGRYKIRKKSIYGG